MRPSILFSAVLALAACKKPDAEPTPSNLSTPPPAAQPAPPPAPKGMSVTTRSAEARAAFDRAMTQLDGFHLASARAELEAAIKADPDFALAHAYLGAETPGAAGDKELARAKELAAGLPAGEQLRIEAMVAERAGDSVTADKKWAELASSTPDDWRAGLTLGQRYLEQRRWQQSIEALKTAQKLNPAIPMIWNSLAYAHAGLQQWEEAVAAAQKQTELLPKEANPIDTYGEILLKAGKLTDAESAFRKATDLDPAFAVAWQGLAYTRAYQGDLAGASEALAKGQAAEKRLDLKAGYDFDRAWLQLAFGKNKEAFAALDAINKNPELAGTVTAAWAWQELAHMLLITNHPAEAQQALDKARAVDISAWNGLEQRMWKRQLNYLALMQAAYTGKPAAEGPLAELEADAKLSPDDRPLQQRMTVARAFVAWAKGDTKGAHDILSTLDPDQPGLRYELYRLELKMGDKAAAAATAKGILAVPQRDVYTILVDRWLDGKP